MNKIGNTLAALVFLSIGIFLVVYSWPPGFAGLQEEEGRLVRIVPHRGTRYNVEILTSSGIVLSCVENGLRGWPPRSINRCPIEKFEPLIGQSVEVLHDGRYVYNVEVNGTTILSYDTFRRFQTMMDVVALVMLGVGVVVGLRAR